MKHAIIFGMAAAVILCGCGQSTPISSSSSGGAGGTTNGGSISNTGGAPNGGGATSGGATSNTGGTSDAGGVCDASIPINVGDICDIESQSDAGAPPDAGSASDLTKPGTFAVGHVTYTLADAAVYGRPVIVSVWYPVDSPTITSTTPPAQYPNDPWSTSVSGLTSTDWEALGYDRAYEGPPTSAKGPFPLVMLSPGWPSGYAGYLYIGTRLASHGFVVAEIDHYQDDASLAQAMFNRPRDVSFAITELLLKNDTLGEPLQGSIDPSRIAASGHSLGGYVAYVLAGGDDEVCDDAWDATYTGVSLSFPQFTCVPTPPDSRIKAIIALDGSSQYLRYQELARISVPSLIMGETVEHSGITDLSYFPKPQPPDPDIGLWIARPHAAINRHDSYRVDITIANHLSFTNGCGASGSVGLCSASGTFDPKNNPATHQIVTTYMLAFLNTYFGREDDSWMLTSSYARQYQPQVEFFDSEACNECPVGKGEYAYRPLPCQCSVAQQDPAGYFAPPNTDGGTP